MTAPIVEVKFGRVPETVREWNNVFSKLGKHLKTEGDQLILTPDVALPDQSVSTNELRDGAVTDQKLRESAGNSVIGRSGGAGPVADIVASADGQFLSRKAGGLEFGVLNDADIPASIARDSEITTAIAAHVAAPDPHPGYLTQTEGDARYRELTDAVTYTELTGKPAALALLFSGTGTPEGVVTASVGALFLRTDGGAGTSLYVKESGAGNTGWIGK